MNGSSRESLDVLQESLAATPPGTDLAGVSADLLAVASLLSATPSLRSTLADGGISTTARTGVVEQLLSTQLTPAGLTTTTAIATSRWSSESDLVEAYETLGTQAALIQAQNDGTLDSVEDDLFRFGRALDASPELQLTLTDPALSGDRKAAVVRDLVGSASPTTGTLLTFVASHLDGRSPQTAVRRLSELAAAQRDQVRADVTSAVELTAEQSQRLSAVLQRLTGRKIVLNVVVEPGARRRSGRARRRRGPSTAASAPDSNRRVAPSPGDRHAPPPHTRRTPATVSPATESRIDMTELTIRPEDIRTRDRAERRVLRAQHDPRRGRPGHRDR